MEEIIQEYQKVNEAAAYIKNRMPFVPKVGIILGTGLGEWTNELVIEGELNTRGVPNMPFPLVASHKGKISFSKIQDVPVVILSGRVHYYEGHALNVVVRPIRILKEIGCTHVIITNAAGGLNADFDAGDVVIIRDHINLMGVNPLRGPNEERWGPRFPDMMHAYDKDWIQFALAQSKEIGLSVKTGVYAGNAGPSLETPAEYAYLHNLGADLVGMSAVPEVIAAHHIGLKILAISVVSNVCYPPEKIKVTTIEEVIGVVKNNAHKAGEVVKKAVTFAL